jgi:hypothetical protein
MQHRKIRVLETKKKARFFEKAGNLQNGIFFFPQNKSKRAEGHGETKAQFEMLESTS